MDVQGITKDIIDKTINFALNFENEHNFSPKVTSERNKGSNL